MKFLHISDLHLGKRLHEAAFLEDQKAILWQIISIAETEQADGVLIAGDIYDKSMPSADAVSLFDEFLTRLAALHLQVFIISGNHDSAERIAYGSNIMRQSGVYLSPVYNGDVQPISLSDEYGTLNVYLLPFVKPAHVRRFAEDETIESYTDALRVAVNKMDVDEGARNVLVTHQFVTGATRSDSEESVGGTDNVDASVFSVFDYVALGHLHGAQNCGSERIRYCGTPLKYSFSEASDTKSVTVITLTKKDEPLQIKTVPIIPKRDLRRIKGTFDELMDKNYYSKQNCEDYLQITLTDEDDIANAMNKLQKVYPNALNLCYDNARTRAESDAFGAEQVENKSALELFAELFVQQNGTEMSEIQRKYMQELIERIEEEEK